MDNFAERIRELRISRDLNQEELGAIVGVGKQAVSSWERNESKPRSNILDKLANHFGVSTDYLLGRNETSDETPEILSDEIKHPKDLAKFLDQSEIMFDGIPLTDDDKEKIKKSLEIIFWDAKQQNKRKKS